MRVALVHDWLTGMRGGEKVLDAICELFPDAPLYTLVHVPGSVSRRIEARRIRTSFAQRLPNPRRFYRHYLPLYPIAVELFDFDGYDLVISSSHCAVKSVVTSGRTVHVCYCHSPMRYGWDQFEWYFGPEQVGPVASPLFRQVMRQLARWDAATAGRVDRFLANSQYVAGRIRRYYNRGSSIVHPPVDTDYFTPDGRFRSPGFLIVSALVPYKRLDLAIEACRRVGAPLKVVGTGPELPRLQALAGRDVEFLGWQPDASLRELYRESAATLLPGLEDFGIVPVEAQACGCPVVALGAGGATETVIDGVTGVLVPEATAETFADGLQMVTRTAFDGDAIRQNALRFSRQQFLTAFKTNIEAAIAGRPGLKTGPHTHPATAGRMPPPVAPNAERRTPSAEVPGQQAGRETNEVAARMPPVAPNAERRTPSVEAPGQQAARETDEAAARMPPPVAPNAERRTPNAAAPGQQAGREANEVAASMPPPVQKAGREDNQ
jgi:glycosyltransferase involved in cell wall biosynthesis